MEHNKNTLKNRIKQTPVWRHLAHTLYGLYKLPWYLNRFNVQLEENSKRLAALEFGLEKQNPDLIQALSLQTQDSNEILKIEAKDVFEIVYGHAPTKADMDYLGKLPTIQDRGGVVPFFRTVINSFDHQRFNTPFTVRFSTDDVEYISTFGVEIAIDRTDNAVGLPLKFGEHEAHLIKFWSQVIKPGMTFIDIGANIGTYSMLGASLVGNTGRILCFEPNSENCRLIKLSALRNGFSNLSICPFALGDRMDHVVFSTAVGSNGVLINDTQKNLSNSNCVIVPMLKLDDVLRTKVDCIKMDVEGAEGLVIRGANRIIEQYRPIITSEFSLEMLQRVSVIKGIDYLRYFIDKGYKVFLVDKQSKELTPIIDINTFVRDYGEIQIEDLAFLPE